MTERKLTAKELKFIEVYSGNATEAARLAGYSGSDNVLSQVGSDNLRKPRIAQAIAKRETRELKPLVANRIQRQEFWSSIMNDSGEEMGYRLKASELLGKSEGDFIERVELDLSASLAERIKAARERAGKQ